MSLFIGKGEREFSSHPTKCHVIKGGKVSKSGAESILGWKINTRLTSMNQKLKCLHHHKLSISGREPHVNELDTPFQNLMLGFPLLGAWISTRRHHDLVYSISLNLKWDVNLGVRMKEIFDEKTLWSFNLIVLFSSVFLFSFMRSSTAISSNIIYWGFLNEK